MPPPAIVCSAPAPRSPSSAPSGRSIRSRCCRRSRCSTSTRHCCPAGAGRRRSSGRSWPATRSPGVCVMRLTAGLDSGPVALREQIPIAADDDYGTLAERLAEAGGALLGTALDRRAGGALEFTEQAGEGVTYAEKIEPPERRVDPSSPARGRGAADPRADAARRRLRDARRRDPIGPPRSAPPRAGGRRRASSRPSAGSLALGCGSGAIAIASRPAARQALDGRRRLPARLRDSRAPPRGRSVERPDSGPAGGLRDPAAGLRGGRMGRSIAPRRRRPARPRGPRAGPGAGARLRGRAAAGHQRPLHRAAQRPLGRAHRPAAAGGAAPRPLRAALRSGGTPTTPRSTRRCALAKGRGGRRRGAGLVNAVLRRAAREREGLLAGLGDGDPARAAVAHSVPVWLAELWWEELGADGARSMLAAINAPPERALRANGLRGDRDGGAAGADRCGRRGRRSRPGIARRHRASRSSSPAAGAGRVEELVAAGLLVPQSRASALVAEVLAPRAGRAGPRPLRRAGDQVRPDRRGARGRGRRARRPSSAIPAAPASCARCSTASAPGPPPSRWGTPPHRALPAASTPSSSTRPARASAPWRRGPTPAGAAGRSRSR